MFERKIHDLRGNSCTLRNPRAQRSTPSPQQQPQAQYNPRLHALNHILNQRLGRLGMAWNTASACPRGPVPPIRQSYTTAPSPSPTTSATPADIEPRQSGSSDPNPFTPIRCSTLAGPLAPPSTNYDLNSPAVIREQLVLQLQMYTLNNGLAQPSAPMVVASTRSSPSRERVNLPPLPVMCGRRRETNRRLRLVKTPVRQGVLVKLFPSVDSIQPRKTSAAGKDAASPTPASIGELSAPLTLAGLRRAGAGTIASSALGSSSLMCSPRCCATRRLAQGFEAAAFAGSVSIPRWAQMEMLPEMLPHIIDIAIVSLVSKVEGNGVAANGLKGVPLASRVRTANYELLGECVLVGLGTEWMRALLALEDTKAAPSFNHAAHM
ncbi:hypothetical protein C2E23DRAFT_888527 [Lenzites betulinus]|nr:hypothetical protein C2E23DRAFT_888527 [Lenzites betulinus]